MAAVAGILAKVGSFLGSPVGASLLGGAGSLLGNFIGGHSLSAQLDVSKKMAQYQHELNMDAWREEVAYNDPARQAERLEAAGFSRHNLVDNTSIAGNASGVPTTQVDTPDISNFQRKYDFSGLFTMAQGLHQLQQFEEQKKVNSSQANVNASIALLNSVKAKNEELESLNKQLRFEIDTFDLMRNKEFFPYDLELKKHSITQAKENINQTLASIGKIKSETASINQTTANNKALYDHWLSRGIHWGSNPISRVMDYFGDTLDATIGRLDTNIAESVKGFIDYLENSDNSDTPVGRAFNLYKRRKKYKRGFWTDRGQIERGLGSPLNPYM